jgi:hypothetical protein
LKDKNIGSREKFKDVDESIHNYITDKTQEMVNVLNNFEEDMEQKRILDYQSYINDHFEIFGHYLYEILKLLLKDFKVVDENRNEDIDTDIQKCLIDLLPSSFYHEFNWDKTIICKEQEDLIQQVNYFRNEARQLNENLTNLQINEINFNNRIIEMTQENKNLKSTNEDILTKIQVAESSNQEKMQRLEVLTREKDTLEA